MTRHASGADPSSVRRWNERAVVLAMESGAQARVSELAAATGLTAPAVRDVLRTLADKGWVGATAAEPGARGRPADRWRLNPVGDVLGLDVGGHMVRGVVFAGDGTWCTVAEVPVREPRLDLAATRAAIAEVVDAVRDRDIWATGVAVSGALDPDGLVVVSVALPQLEGYRPDELLGDLLPGRVVVCHDTRSKLWAEHREGVAQGYRHVLLVHLGRRPSLAQLVDGRPYAGAHGTAGDLSLSDLIPDDELADPVAFLRRVTPQVAFAASLADPELVVLAGPLAARASDALEEVRSAFAALVQRPPLVAVSSLDQYATAIGAAHAARDELRHLLIDDPAGLRPLARSSVAG